MKLLSRLQNNKFTWYFLIICIVFVLLRLPSLIEPYWYGDEGIYEVIGKAMSHGEILYRDIWDNKPPLLYLIYASAQGDQATVKAFALFVGLAAVIAFCILAYKFFHNSKTTMTITALFVFLFGTPLLEGDIANAENFTLFFSILSGFLIYQLATKGQSPNIRRDKLLTVGLVLGIAFLLKIVVVFDLIGFAFFLFLLHLPDTLSRAHMKQLTKSYLSQISFLLIGFLVPFLITIISFASMHNVKYFIQATFLGNVDYVAYQNVLFGIPQGLLIIKVILLFVGMVLLVRYRNRFATQSLFITIWLLFSLFNAFFSGRPYTHYVLVILPSLCLLLGLGLANHNLRQKRLQLTTFFAIVVFIGTQFLFYPAHTIFYYPNVISFLTGNETITDYRAFFDAKTPRDYELAAFIRKNTQPSDKVFIWGDNAQVYALSGKLPPTKYTVAYHLTQNNVAVAETQREIEAAKPKYIITMDETPPLPFSLPVYIMLFRIPGATIYERHL